MALYLSREPSILYFTMNTYLHPSRLFSLGNSTTSQVPFFSSASILALMACFRSLLFSALDKVLGMAMAFRLVRKFLQDDNNLS